jgi:hypothetical protein
MRRMVGLLFIVAGIALNIFLFEAAIGRSTADLGVRPAIWCMQAALVITGAGILLWRHKRMKPVRKRWRELLLLAIVTIVMLFIIDLAIGSVDAYRARSVVAEKLEYVFNTSLNSEGFRGEEFGEKGPSGYRILFIGDSFVYGITDDEHTIPHLLWLRLAPRSSRAFEVYNLGVPGAAPYDYVRTAYEDHDGDMMLVGIYVDNDIEGYDSSADKYRRAYTLLEKASVPHVRGTISRILTDDEQRIMQIFDEHPEIDSAYAPIFIAGKANPHLLVKSTTEKDYTAYYREKARVFREKDATRQHILQLKRIADEDGMRFAVIIFPSKYQVSEKNWGNAQEIGFNLSDELLKEQHIQDAMMLFCMQENLTCIDLLPEFRAHGDEQLYYAIDDHMTPRGNELAAQAIYESLFT